MLLVCFFFASSGSHSRIECIAFTLSVRGETRKAITCLKGFGSSSDRVANSMPCCLFYCPLTFRKSKGTIEKTTRHWGKSVLLQKINIKTLAEMSINFFLIQTFVNSNKPV